MVTLYLTAKHIEHYIMEKKKSAKKNFMQTNKIYLKQIMIQFMPTKMFLAIEDILYGTKIANSLKNLVQE